MCVLIEENWYMIIERKYLGYGINPSWVNGHGKVPKEEEL
jgi:hypothetical protein